MLSGCSGQPSIGLIAAMVIIFRLLRFSIFKATIDVSAFSARFSCLRSALQAQSPTAIVPARGPSDGGDVRRCTRQSR